MVLIQERGWIQGAGTKYDVEGNFVGHCILGAISWACDSDMDMFCERIEAERAVANVIDPNRIFSPTGTIAVYNDAPERSVEDVLLVMKQAVCDLEGR